MTGWIVASLIYTWASWTHFKIESQFCDSPSLLEAWLWPFILISYWLDR